MGGRMIRLEVNNGDFVEDYDYTEGMTADDLIMKFKEKYHFRWQGFPLLMDTSQNFAISGSAELMDGRIYAMQVFITAQVDEQGNVIGRTV
jgi:hypothetical protein